MGGPGSEQNIVMIAHRNTGKNVNLKTLRHLLDRIKNAVTIIIVNKSVAALFVTGLQMVEGSLIFNPPGSVNKNQIPTEMRNGNSYSLFKL